MNDLSQRLESILGRKEHNLEDFLSEAANFYMGKNILITGADGSLGHGISSFIKDYNINCNLIKGDIVYDDNLIDNQYYLDICSKESTERLISLSNPDIIFHFAADKHAPSGEDTPESTIDINLVGTGNLINSINHLKTLIVLASTCKSNNPETVYGATKLIAERLVLNAGHNVARYYNVVETSGNVFEIWENESSVNKHRVMPCERFFISLKEAVALTLFTGMQASGRYTVNPGNIRYMPDVYKDLFGYCAKISEARRGDRIIELRVSTSERIRSTEYDGIFEKIISNHDI